MDGSQVVAVKDLGLDYNVFELISKGLSVDEIRLNQPVLYLRRDGDTWSISRLIKKQEQEADRQGPAKPIADRRHRDHATLRSSSTSRSGRRGSSVPDRFDRLDAKLSFEYEPVHYSVEITHVSFRGSDPAIGAERVVRRRRGHGRHLVRGQAGASDRGNVAVGRRRGPAVSDHADLQRPDRLRQDVAAGDRAPRAGARRRPARSRRSRSSSNGPMDRLGVDMNVRSSAGQIAGHS